MKRILYIVAAMLAVSCDSEPEFDAQGTFEAVEVVVSSEAAGHILYFNVEEGSSVTAGATVGAIDSLQLHLQHKQLSAQLSALLGSRPDIKAQVASLREQIVKQRTERSRVDNMLRDGAATQKQLDDIEAQIRVLESQLTATLSTRSVRIPPLSTTTLLHWRRRPPHWMTVSPNVVLYRLSTERCW